MELKAPNGQPDSASSSLGYKCLLLYLAFMWVLGSKLRSPYLLSRVTTECFTLALTDTFLNSRLSLISLGLSFSEHPCGHDKG